MIKPKALRKGDLIAVAASASPFNKNDFLFAVKKLQEMGFKVTFRKDIFAKERYLAGDDKRRANELNRFFSDPNVKAVFFARGGYGTQRILHLLDIEAVKACPKIVLGYSDLTALHIYLYHHGIGGTFYGPTIARHLKTAHKKTLEGLFSLITSSAPAGHLTLTGSHVEKRGTAEGPLVGGCLTLVEGSIGTPYELATQDSILFLEDVSEPVYKYDRMLTHLKSAGKFRDVKGIIFGSIGLAKGENKNWLKPMLKDVLGDFPGPIITNFPAGHFDLKKLFVTLPLGVNARLTTNPLSLEVLEPSLL